MKAKTILNMNFKSGKNIPVGSEVNIIVNKEQPTRAIITFEDIKAKIPSAYLYKFFNEFTEYNTEDIQNGVYDGTCISLTGETVEPDGWDPNGFPSILLANGLI